MGLYLTRLGDDHTTLDFVLVDTTEEETDIVTSLTFVEDLTEHFDTRHDRLKTICTETDDLDFVTRVDNTRFDTTGSDGTTTRDREDIFDRHEEGLIDITWRQWDPGVDSVHQFHDLIFPLSFPVEGTEGRTTDNRRVVAVEVVAGEKLTHIHFYEFEHFFVVDHVALVHEDNKARNVYLASEKHVFARLRHRTIRSSYYDDSTVHLSSTRDHVLHIVGVTWAVNVSVVTVSRFVLNV